MSFTTSYRGRYYPEQSSSSQPYSRKRSYDDYQEGRAPASSAASSETSPRRSYSNYHSHRANRVPRPSSPPQIIRKTHYLPMKGVVYLDAIKNGLKTHEGRINRGTCQAMRIGDYLELKDERAKRGILCKITSRDVYRSFKEMLLAKGILNMLPQLKPQERTLNKEELLERGITIYRAFPGSQDVQRLGVAAIGVQFLRDL